MLTHASGKPGTACKADLACIKKSNTVCSFGPAILFIYYMDELNMWVASNGDRISVIEHCPFCGIELKTISDRIEAD